MIDIDRIRAETPATSRLIHLNNAGTSLTPKPVLDAVVDYLHEEAEVGGYEMADKHSAALRGVYDSVARLIGAQADEIALLESATAAWQRAFYAMRFQPGDRIITARAEYAANYLPLLQVTQRTGAVIDVVGDNEYGEIDLTALERMITPRTRLIAITWIPSNGGLVNPAAEVGKIARRHAIPYLLDACQAVGQLHIDVNAIGCDMLSATGRKFLRAPRGTGFLYVRKDFITKLDPWTIDQTSASLIAPDKFTIHENARRFESFEHSPALRLGMGAAAEYALAIGLDQIEARCRHLGNYLRTGLSELNGVDVYDLGRTPAAIVTFGIDGNDPNAAHRHLADAGINVSISGTTSTPLDTDARQLPTLLRASPHYYNTEAELDRTIAACAAMMRRSQPYNA